MMKAYGQSKLCNVLFAAELHRRERAVQSGVVACSCHPGAFIPTDIGRGRWCKRTREMMLSSSCDSPHLYRFLMDS